MKSNKILVKIIWNRLENNFQDLISMTLWIKVNLKVGDQVSLEISNRNRIYKKAIFQDLGSMPLEMFKYLKITQARQNNQKIWEKKFNKKKLMRYQNKVKTVLTFLNKRILSSSLKEMIFLTQK